MNRARNENRFASPKRGSPMAVGWLILLLPLATHASGVVTSPTDTNLRAAMAGGGSVTFACEGTIILSDTITNNLNTTLDARGHRITISGSNTYRVFSVATNATLTVLGLTIADGFSEFGAGINNIGGTVNLIEAVLAHNVALASGGRGGALCNWGGVINATNCGFHGNLAQSRTNTTRGDSVGGAIFNAAGLVNLQGCHFSSNNAWATLMGEGYQFGLPTMAGSNGYGGAICNLGSLQANACTFSDNSTQGGMGGEGAPANPYVPTSRGGPGGDGGFARGGAIFNSGTATITATTFVGNRVNGGYGGYGGGGIMPFYYSIGSPGGNGGFGGPGLGAAVFNQGVAQLGNCTVVSNQCLGGNGGTGGHGGDGYDHTVGGDGGNGGAGGDGLGNLHGAFALTNCTVALNLAVGGAGGAGGTGGSVPGGPPYAFPGDPGSPGTNGNALGGALASGDGIRLVNTLLATNAPGGNAWGTLCDLGHNISSDASCNFTNEGSQNDTNPKLGSLADNGGPTLTLALLSGSPAIDTGDTAFAPTVDQRGRPRPYGPTVDIGAYESMPLLRITRALGNIMAIQIFDAPANQSCCLQVSATLTNWQHVKTNGINADGTSLFMEDYDPTMAKRFYRVVNP